MGGGTHGVFLPPVLEEANGTYALFFDDYTTDKLFDVYAPDGGWIDTFDAWDFAFVDDHVSSFNAFMNGEYNLGLGVMQYPSPDADYLCLEGNEYGEFVAAYREAAGGSAMLWSTQPTDGGAISRHFATLNPAGELAIPDTIISVRPPEAARSATHMGTTLDGERLVLEQTDAGSTVTWISRDGVVGPPLEATGVPAFTFTELPNLLAPLADGTLALRASGTWVGVFAPGGTSLQPPPAWLAALGSDEQVELVAHGRGYVVYGVSQPGCEASVELVDATGLSCGSLTLDMQTTACGGRLMRGGGGSFFAFLQTWDTRIRDQVTGVVRRWPRLVP